MNAIRTAAALAAVSSLVACSRGADADGGGTSGANLAAASAPEAAAPGCADGLPVHLDRDPTAMVDWKTFPATRLEAFRAKAAGVFRAAADAACRSAPKVAAAMGPIRRILVQSGSGATEPVFYQVDGSDDLLIFQYAFAEAKLAVPDPATIRQGLQCWADADGKGCEDMGD
jgi:hypothetical protein